jgi:hypothetical protein
VDEAVRHRLRAHCKRRNIRFNPAHAGLLVDAVQAAVINGSVA